MVDFVPVPINDKIIEVGAQWLGDHGRQFLAPYLEGRRARIEGEIAIMQAETAARLTSVLNHPDPHVMAMNFYLYEELRGRMSKSQVSNIISVLHETRVEHGDKAVSSESPDPDWINRFFNEVKDVSSEEMRNIWAKLLSGEIESPGRSSLRTLDVLRNMTVSDAKMFAEVCGFVFGIGKHLWIWRDKENKHIPFDSLLHLEDCGLVELGGGSLTVNINWITATQQEWGVRLYHQGKWFLATKDPHLDSTDKLTLSAVLFTSSGRELFQFVQQTVPREEYLRSFASFLKRTQKGCQLFRLEETTTLPDGTILTNRRVPVL